MAAQITARDTQTLLDIAIQERGTMESAMELAIANGLALSDELQPGQPIAIPDTVWDRFMQGRCDSEQVTPATEITQAALKMGGIGYMGIRIDFIVSKEKTEYGTNNITD